MTLDAAEIQALSETLDDEYKSTQTQILNGVEDETFYQFRRQN